MAKTFIRKFTTSLLVIFFFVAIFVVTATSIDPLVRDTVSQFSRNTDLSSSMMSPDLIALADKNGGGSTPKVTSTASLFGSWTDTGTVKRLAYSLGSIVFDSTNVSYYRTSGSGADCGITAGTGSFSAGETEKHWGYTPTLYVVAYLSLDSNLIAIRNSSTLTATFTASVSGDKNLRWGILATNTLQNATSSWPDNNVRTATVSPSYNYLALTFRTNSGVSYQTRISVSSMTITFESSDITAPGTSLTGIYNYNDGAGAKNYATSTSAGFSSTDNAVGVYNLRLQRQAFGITGFTDVYDKVGTTLTLSEAGYGSSFADYRIVSFDRVGNNTTSAVIRNWIPTLKTTDTGQSGGTTTASITGGTQYVGSANNSTTTSLTRYPGQVFYLRAQPSMEYLFDGFDIEYSGLNTSLTTSVSYASFTYSEGFFYYGITLSSNLCTIGQTYTSIAFKAKFTSGSVGNPNQYVLDYNGANQPFLASSSTYLSTNALGADREAVVSEYKPSAGSWTASIPMSAETYDIRVLVRNKTTTTIIYGTYEFNEAMKIKRKRVTIAFASANKVYDGTTWAATSTFTLSGGIAGDSLALSGGTCSFPDKNVGNSKQVTMSGFTITGANLNSYDYVSNVKTVNLENQTGGVMGVKVSNHNITSYTGLSLSLKLVEGHKNKTRVYDFTDFVDSNWFEVVLTGKAYGSDVISWNNDGTATAITTGKTVGTQFFQSSNIKLTGADCTNYLIQEKSWTASTTYTANSSYAGAGYNTISITPKLIGITVTANNKEYDGTTSALGTTTLDPVIGGGSNDAIYLNSGIVYTFADKHTGTAKTVTASNLSVNTGASVGLGNYTVSFTNNTAAANITKKNITIAMSCTGKVFDGGTSVSGGTLSFTYPGIVSSDASDYAGGIANPTWIKMGTTVTFAYSSPNVSLGSAQVSATSALYLEGSSANNYTITNSSLTCSTSITPKTIVGNVTVAPISSITYDKDSHEPLPSVTDNALAIPLVNTTDFTYSYVASPINVGTYTVTILGAGNYQGQVTASFNIVKANVTLSANNISVTYGSNVDNNSIVGTAVNTTKPTVSLTGGTFAFDASTPMTLTPQVSQSEIYKVKYTLSGTDAPNYNAPSTINITLTVSKRNITVTAQNKSQTFGENPVSLTWISVDPQNSLSNGIVGSDNLGIALKCIKNVPVGKTHSNVGVFTIERDTAVTLNPNYDFTFNNGTYTISTRSISLTPSGNQKKTYGSDDIVFTYTLLDLVSLGNTLTSVLSDCPVIGILSREDTAFIGGLGNAGRENVGFYRIIQNTLTSENNTNYNIQFSATVVGFEIEKRNIQISAPTLSTVYGETLLPFNYIITQGSLVGGDTLVGSFSRTINAQSTMETTSLAVGTYVLKDNIVPANQFAYAPSNPNYNVSLVTSGSYTITVRPITVTPTSGQSKIYGESNLTLTYSLSYTGDPGKDALVGTDFLSGNLTRAAGENVGTYSISKGTLANSNYLITLSSEVFTINQKGIVVTAKQWITDYGSTVKTNDQLTWTTNPTSLPFSDLLQGQLYLDNTQWTLDEFGAVPVGSYDISQGTVDSTSNPNYSITFVGAGRYIINMLVANIKPRAGQNMIYGQTLVDLYNSGLTFMAYTNGGVQIAASYFTGKLHLDTEVATPTPGSYQIVQGTLSSATHEINMNYERIGTEGSYQIVPCAETYFTINKRTISIRPTSVSQIFGEDEITSLTYTIASGSLVSGDTLSGSLLRESPGTRLTVGTYNIYIGTVTHAQSYYNISIVDNIGKYAVTKRPIMINPIAASSVYGQAESPITYNVSLGQGFVSTYNPLVEGYSLNGTLTRANTNLLVVGNYPITLGNLVELNSNYQIALNPETVNYSITKRALSVKANDQTQVFGSAAKELSYIFIDGTRTATWDNGKLNPLTLLERAEGNVVGTYVIGPGNILNPALNPNYNITFTAGNYTITPKAITVVPLANQTKGYGLLDPVFSYSVSATIGGLVDGYPLQGVLSREVGESVGSYRITQGTIDNLEGRNPNYTISFNNQVTFGITQANSSISFNDATTLVEGQYLLSLIYNAELQSIDASLNHSETTISYSISNSFRNVGEYTITLSASPTRNYRATSVSVVVEISPYELSNISREAIVDNMANLTKVYGEQDKQLQKTIPALGEDAPIIVIYSREVGEAVGLYSLSILSTSSNNYIASLAANAGDDVFTINKRAIVLNQISTITNVFDGVANGSKTTNYATGFFQNVIQITYYKAIGSDVGAYDIVSYEIDATSQLNYTLTISDLLDKFVITRRPVYVSADAKTLQYGDAAKSLTYTVSEPTLDSGLVGFDSLKGEIVRTAGNDAGVYPITQGTLNNEQNPNYDVNFTGAIYTITKVAVTITPNAVTRQYGEDPLALSYALSRALIGTDVLEGELTREDTIMVGVYDILQGTLDNNNGRNKNYQLSYTSGIKYTITKRDLTITPTAVSQIYGDMVTQVTYEIISGSLAYQETTLYGKLGRSGTDVGTYDITLGELPSSNPNYNITLIDNEDKYTIVKRPITLQANNLTQVYGNPAIPLTYSVTQGSIVTGDTFSGSLVRGGGSAKTVGVYTIFGNTILNSNYDVTFINGTYTITQREITITLQNQQNMYVENEAQLIVNQSAFEITTGSLAPNESKSVLNVQIAKEAGKSMGHYELTGTYNNANYLVTFVNGIFTILKYSSEITTDPLNLIFTYDGNARSIDATCSSSEDVIFFVNGVQVQNAFVNPGRYIVTLTAPESEEYYAPPEVVVTVSIYKDKLQSEANGIDATMVTDDGFEPELILSLEKADTNSKEIQDHLTRYQDVIRSFNLTVINASDQSVVEKGISSIRIKVPSAVEGNETVQVLVAQNGVYSSYELTVEEGGYVTITGDNITSISFLSETNSNVFLYAIIGIIALIVVIGFGAFLFRKRY